MSLHPETPHPARNSPGSLHRPLPTVSVSCPPQICGHSATPGAACTPGAVFRPIGLSVPSFPRGRGLGPHRPIRSPGEWQARADCPVEEGARSIGLGPAWGFPSHTSLPQVPPWKSSDPSRAQDGESGSPGADEAEGRFSVPVFEVGTIAPPFFPSGDRRKAPNPPLPLPGLPATVAPADHPCPALCTAPPIPGNRPTPSAWNAHASGLTASLQGLP